MQLKAIRNSSLEEMNSRAGAFVAACGYEQRSSALVPHIATPEHYRFAFCFAEWSEALSRRANEAKFREHGFQLLAAGGNDSEEVEKLVAGILDLAAVQKHGAIAFDISSMTRAWHGAVVRSLRTKELALPIETFFVYVPARYRRPPRFIPPNEFVSPVDGFSSLRPADLPLAAIIGLGYERHRALGLQQLLDPERTMLMIPNSVHFDPFYPDVMRGNRDILQRTSMDWVFEYDITQPAAIFSTLDSIISGLRDSYRVVLASLGPKIFGLICFLLATRFVDVSVWRVSSGVHGLPRDAKAHLDKTVVLSAVWEPSRS